MKTGIYPGTFDPITAGHLDIMLRALKVVDKLYIGIAADSVKSTLFNSDERMLMINQELRANGVKDDLIKVEVFSGLLTEYAKAKNADIIIRGLRAVSDFEYEFQMSCMNSILDNELQTIFLPAASKLQLVSSRIVKEVARLGGNTGDFISDNVKEKLASKYQLIK